MSHRNAPLTPAGRLRLVQRCQSRPIAHVAAGAGVSRQCLSKWVGRYRREGELGLLERSSAPHRQPTSLPSASTPSAARHFVTRATAAHTTASDIVQNALRSYLAG